MSQKETMLHGWRFNQPLSELAKAIEMTSAVYGEGLKLVEYLLERVRRAESKQIEMPIENIEVKFSEP